MILRRRVMDNIASLPYDKEITYLESSGTQYIDTGLTGGTNAEYEIRCQVLNTSDNYDNLFGSRYNNSENTKSVPRVYYHTQNSGSLGCVYFDTSSHTKQLRNGNANGKPYDIHTYTYKNGVFSDGKTDITVGENGFKNKNFWIFAYPDEANYKTDMRLYYAKIWLEGTLVRDFIPVRVGQVGYLYDKVNGVLYGNSGTGNFIIGESYPHGVYAYYSDGSLKSESEADSNAIGVAVITPNCRFVIDKTRTPNGTGTKLAFGARDKDLTGIGVMITSDETTAKQDFDGAGNTQKIIAAYAGYTSTGVTGAPAAEACAAAFDGHGYMGSLGEWNEAYANKSAIGSMITKIGGQGIQYTDHTWTSTLYTANNKSWRIAWQDGSVGGPTRTDTRFVRAFMAI